MLSKLLENFAYVGVLSLALGFALGKSLGRPFLVLKLPLITLLGYALCYPFGLAKMIGFGTVFAVVLVLFFASSFLPARVRLPRLLAAILENRREDELRGDTPSDVHGSAAFGTAPQAFERGHLVPVHQPAGFVLGRMDHLELPSSLKSHNLDPRFRYVGHVVTIAKTGSGKGIGAVIPTLLEYQGSCLAIDVKGENYAVTARARRELGQAVHVVDPFGVTGAPGDAFNPLDRIDPLSPDCVSDASLLADALAMGESQGENVHFEESAKSLLQGLVLHVAGAVDPSKRTLGELRRLLTANAEDLAATLAEMSENEAAACGVPARAANTLMSMGDRERGSVLSTARRHTAFLDDPRIAECLSRSDFNLQDLKYAPMTVYLVLPANRIEPNARLLRAFIGAALAGVTASADRPAHNVAFLLDEFGQLGYLKQLEDAVSLLRGYGVSFWIFVQDLSQLRGVYRRWQTFLANSAKTFFGTSDVDTAKYISESLGQTTVSFATQNTGSSEGSSSNGVLSAGSSSTNSSAGWSQQLTGRALLTPDEVMRLPSDRLLAILDGESPYLLLRPNYLRDPEYAGTFDENPYHTAAPAPAIGGP